jgi:hypothetical protein
MQPGEQAADFICLGQDGANFFSRHETKTACPNQVRFQFSEGAICNCNEPYELARRSPPSKNTDSARLIARCQTIRS